MTKTARLEVRIDPELKQRLDAYAAQNPGTVAEHVRYAILRYLNVRELDPPPSDATCDICGRPLDYYWKCPICD